MLTDKASEIDKLQNTSTLEREEFEKLKKQMILLEDQLMQTRQLKDQYEDRIEQLTNDNENLLKSENEKLPQGTVRTEFQQRDKQRSRERRPSYDRAWINHSMR